MSSIFINKHLAKEPPIDVDGPLHILELFPTDFQHLSIDFHPGFLERNAFLGQFKSTRKQRKKKEKEYSDETPIMYNEHKTHSNIHRVSESIDSFKHSLRTLSNIPVGSRLRYIDATDCQDMMYCKIMALLASSLVQSQTNIILKFETAKHIEQKVKTSNGAVMAWNIKQEILGTKNKKNREKCCKYVNHSCVRDTVDSWYITLLIFIVILYDLSIAFYVAMDIVLELTLFALTLYAIELVFRCYGYRSYTYMTRGWFEFIDSFIIICSLLVTVCGIIMLPLLSLYELYEYLRIVRVILRIIVAIKNIPKSIRLIVRVNRQTYFDDKFDLDLCYIVYPQYLVMSWPSSGFESLYRNPLKNVAKFLNTYHAGNYLIFDLCKERSYDDTLFSGRVMRSRAMSDHSVCSLSDMFEFAFLVHLWLKHNPIHCTVIHCRGGKGRTGLMVCACLMYHYRDTTVNEALQYFATMRTNITKSGKLQGVETPSQLRYCKYFYQLLHITDALKIKENNMSNRRSHSLSPKTHHFYRMVTSATPPPHDIDIDINDDDERIIDDHTRTKIAKHLDYNDLNISGLKQNKHVHGSGRTSVYSLGNHRRYKTSDVPMSILKLDRDKIYVRGQWETSNPVIAAQLLLHERFRESNEERQRDSTVMAQSLAQSNIVNADAADDDHFVSINNDSYLSELFLKQSVIMQLDHVSIGPFASDEWNNKCIHWKIEICMKPDFDYFDGMKIYEFTSCVCLNFNKLKFSAMHNLKDGNTSLNLNGNICFKIFRCRNEATKDEMIGSIWIHSHFVAANYTQKLDKMMFRKDEIDIMYKDKKHKTSVSQSFCVEIGYRSSRINRDSVDNHKQHKTKQKTALI